MDGEVFKELAEMLNKAAGKQHRPDGAALTNLREILARHTELMGPVLLREVADDWEVKADEFERLWRGLATKSQAGDRYRWGATMLRGRAQMMESQPYVD
jgi:hypothetical protein